MRRLGGGEQPRQRLVHLLAQAEEEEETSSTFPSLSEDAANARKLTSKDELLARPFESVFEDVQKTLEYQVRWAVEVRPDIGQIFEVPRRERHRFPSCG